MTFIVAKLGVMKGKDLVQVHLLLLQPRHEKSSLSSLLIIPSAHFLIHLVEWMPLVLEQHPNLTYLGLDVVFKVIAANKQRLPHLNFQQHDLTLSPLPKGFDLLLSRDTLQHLNHDNVKKVLKYFRESGAKFLLVGSYPIGQNTDITNGGYFSIDLKKPPFNDLLPPPLAIFDEKYGYKYLYAYDLRKLAEVSSR